MKENKYYDRLLTNKLTRSSESFDEVLKTTNQDKLFFYPFNFPTGSNKNFEIKDYNPLSNKGKNKYSKINYFYESKPKVNSNLFNLTDDDVQLSPRNRICKKTRNRKTRSNLDSTYEYPVKKSVTNTKLNLLEMTVNSSSTKTNSDQHEAEHKMILKDFFLGKKEDKQISETTKNKLNNIYQLAGQEIG